MLVLCSLPHIHRTASNFVLVGKLLTLATLALPALQLLPLPAPLWSALPGRALVQAVLAAIGAPAAPRSLSVDPAATLAAMLELLPGVALFLAAIRLEPARHSQLLALIVAVALVSALLGAFRRATGLATFVADAHAGYAPGLFVNRNHQATFLLVAIVLAPAVASRISRAAIAVLALIFAAGVIATTSRAGFALLPLALLLASLLTFGRRIDHRRALVTVAVSAAILALATASGAVRLVADRFQQGSERYAYWRAIWPAIRDYAPWGSGIGTFDRVFPLYEPDTLIGPFRIVAAHNDYLQLLLEGGAPALVLIAAALVLLATAAIRLMRRPGREARLGLSAAAGLAIILMHSLVDFPLRMISLSATFGLLAAVLLTAADRRSRSA